MVNGGSCRDPIFAIHNSPITIHDARMRFILRSPVAAAFVTVALLNAPISHAFGPEGHEAVGEFAELSLRDTNAGRRVREILGNQSLARASNWADWVKGGGFDDESRSFVRNNPRHHDYHFVNVPFQAAAYRFGGFGTRTDDVVQMSRKCIRVLQGNTSENPEKLTLRVALRLLAHYIGDIHQPLHCGCGYIDRRTNTFVDPRRVAAAVSDRGGNDLLYRNTKLHGFFDSPLVRAAMADNGAGSGRELGRKLHAAAQPDKTWKGTGSVMNWPAQWASKAIRTSRDVYGNLQIAGPRGDKWEVTAPASFDTDSREALEQQIAKGGYRLAELLKEIWP